MSTSENDALNSAAQELQRHGGNVEPVQVDLATEQGVEELYGRMVAAGRPVDAVALNAGVGAGGAFANGTELAEDLGLIDLNVRSTVYLAKYVARDMLARRAGRILFTSSIASTMPGPTATRFFARAHLLDTRMGVMRKDNPADVARAGFEALMAGKERVIAASLSTKAQGRGSRFVPDSVKAKVHRVLAEPGSAKK
jgi:short-subunit dehydrogenase